MHILSLGLRLGVIGRVLTLFVRWRFFFVHAFLSSNLLLLRLCVNPARQRVMLLLLHRVDGYAGAPVFEDLWVGGRDHPVGGTGTAKTCLGLHVKFLLVVILRESFLFVRVLLDKHC